MIFVKQKHILCRKTTFFVEYHLKQFDFSSNIEISFEKDVFPFLSESSLLTNCTLQGQFFDVGTRESYIEANCIDNNYLFDCNHTEQSPGALADTPWAEDPATAHHRHSSASAPSSCRGTYHTYLQTKSTLSHPPCYAHLTAGSIRHFFQLKICFKINAPCFAIICNGILEMHLMNSNVEPFRRIALTRATRLQKQSQGTSLR